jgi:hypothetical protein
MLGLLLRVQPLLTVLLTKRLSLYGVQVNKVDYGRLLLKWNFTFDELFFSLDEL